MPNSTNDLCPQQDMNAIAQELRLLLKVRSQKKRFLKTFSTFNQHAYFNDQAKIENAKDTIFDAESKIIRLLNTIRSTHPDDGEAKIRMAQLGQILLPLAIEDGVDLGELLSKEHPGMAEISAILLYLQKARDVARG